MTNTIISIQKKENHIEMVCESDFTLKNAKLIKESLMESTIRTGDESLDLRNVQALDVSCIQLVYAWKQTLLSQGRKALVLLPSADSLCDLFQKTGITTIL